MELTEWSYCVPLAGGWCGLRVVEVDGELRDVEVVGGGAVGPRVVGGAHVCEPVEEELV